MKVIDHKKIRELKKSGRSVRVISRPDKKLPEPEKKPEPEKQPDNLDVIAELLRKLIAKEVPVPVASVTVQPAEVVIPESRRISKLGIVRDEKGFIKTIIPEYSE